MYLKCTGEMTLSVPRIKHVCIHDLQNFRVDRLGSSVGRVSAPRSGGTGFDPGPRHTKVVNNGTSLALGFSG